MRELLGLQLGCIWEADCGEEVARNIDKAFYWQSIFLAFYEVNVNRTAYLGPILSNIELGHVVGVHVFPVA